MTTPPRPSAASNDANSFEACVHEYLKKTNRLIPTTPEDVEAMERWIAAQDIQVPEELLRQHGCSLTPSQPSARILKFPTQSNEVEMGLARAAREGGKPISPEVEQRMKRDREQKERELKG
jgi:hypothetical protein